MLEITWSAWLLLLTKRQSRHTDMLCTKVLGQRSCFAHVKLRISTDKPCEELTLAYIKGSCSLALLALACIESRLWSKQLLANQIAYCPSVFSTFYGKLQLWCSHLHSLHSLSRVVHAQVPTFQLLPYSALISRNLNFVDSCLQSFRWINFTVPFALLQVLSKLPHLQCVSWYMHMHTPYYHAHKLIWQLFIHVSRNRRLGDGDGYNHVRNGGYGSWLSRIPNINRLIRHR